jgi:hypothetical protein
MDDATQRKGQGLDDATQRKVDKDYRPSECTIVNDEAMLFMPCNNKVKKTHEEI